MSNLGDNSKVTCVYMKKLLLILVLATVACTPAISGSTWVIPARVILDNMYPGSYADQTIKIHNGKSVSSRYIIRYKAPDSDGSVAPPKNSDQWVTISNPNPVVKSGETYNVLVAIYIPTDAAPPSWKFWISTQDVSTPDHPEMYQQWEVNMK